MSRAALPLATGLRSVGRRTRADRAEAAAHWRAAAPSLAIATLAIAVSLPLMGSGSNLSPDSFAYLTAARSLYETGHLPPERMVTPPGLPLLLAPLMALGEVPTLAFRLLAAVCLAATAVMTWRLFRRGIGGRAAFAAATS